MSKKSSNPKLVDGGDDKDPSYYFQYSEDRTQVMVTMIYKHKVAGTDEVLADLQVFIDDVIEQETNLFDENDADAGDDTGMVH